MRYSGDDSRREPPSGSSRPCPPPPRTSQVNASELQQERERFNRSDEERRQLSADVMRIRGEREQLRIELRALKDFITSRGLTLPTISMPPPSVFQPGGCPLDVGASLGGEVSWYR